MSALTSSANEKSALTTDPGRRRSMRVLLSVTIVVSGKNADSQPFSEETRTLVVNAHGALIGLATRLAASQQITLANRATKQSLQCRVVHVGPAQIGKMQLGIEFVKPSPGFWQIDFPPDDWVIPED
jgi:hypothetical protein